MLERIGVFRRNVTQNWAFFSCRRSIGFQKKGCFGVACLFGSPQEAKIHLKRGLKPDPFCQLSGPGHRQDGLAGSVGGLAGDLPHAAAEGALPGPWRQADPRGRSQVSFGCMDGEMGGWMVGGVEVGVWWGGVGVIDFVLLIPFVFPFVGVNAIGAPTEVREPHTYQVN